MTLYTIHSLIINDRNVNNEFKPPDTPSRIRLYFPCA